jgi:death-on-curing protein
LLESALAQPQTIFGGSFLHTDLFEMAAAYFFHIIQNHPFMDGNKRVGAVPALVFLEMNNKTVIMTNDELESQVLSVAQGLTDKTDSAKFFLEHEV